jgi:hypothetical protein
MYNASTIVSGSKETIEFLTAVLPSTDRAVREALDELGDIAIDRIRNIIIQGTSYGGGLYVYSSGRLLASVGKYDANYGGQESGGSEADAVFDIKRQGDRYQVIIGTNVPWAAYIEDGFTMTGPRAVRMPDGQWRTVRSFTFSGLHAFEQGFESINPILNIILGTKMKQAGWSQKFKYLSDVGNISVS